MPLILSQTWNSFHVKRKKRGRSDSAVDMVRALFSSWCGMSENSDGYNNANEVHTAVSDVQLFSNKISLFNVFLHLFTANLEHDIGSWGILLVLTERMIARLASGQSLPQEIQHCFAPQSLIQTLLTLYGIAFKWHYDYRVVTLEYVVDLLPLEVSQHNRVVRHICRLERYFLQFLDFDCLVTKSDLRSTLHSSIPVVESRIILSAMDKEMDLLE